MKDLGINRFSPSMIMDYEGCPRKFYYSTYLGLKLPQSMKHLKFGTAIHAALDNTYNQYTEGSAWGLAERSIAVNIFKETFPLSSLDPDERNMKGELVYPSEAERVAGWEEMTNDGVAILKEFWDQKEVLLAENGINPTDLEVVVKMPITNLITKEPFEIPLSCRLDGLNADNSIVEFKTSSGKYDERETRKSAQSLTYVLAKYQETGKIHPLTYVVFLKKKKTEGRIQILRYEYDEADLLAFCGRIEAFIEGVRLQRFDKPTMNHPRFCDCDKYSSMIEGL